MLEGNEIENPVDGASGRGYISRRSITYEYGRKKNQMPGDREETGRIIADVSGSMGGARLCRALMTT